MIEALDIVSDFDTDVLLSDDDLRPCGRSDTLPYEAMLTERQQPAYQVWTQSRSGQALSAEIDDTIPMAPWVIDMLSKIQELCALETNWDSYGSPPPSVAVMAEALILLQRAECGLRHSPSEDAAIPIPTVVPLSGGGLQFEWQTPLKELELEFFEDQPPTALAVDTSTGWEGEVTFDPDDSTTICNLLAWLTAH